MNEYEAVFTIMVAGGWRGVSVKELARRMGLKGELGEWYAIRALVGVAMAMRPLGLAVRFNPLTGRWIATYRSGGLTGGGGLPKRLRATLAAVFKVQGERGRASLEEIIAVRGKSRRSTLEDLKRLEELRLVERVGKREFRVSDVVAPFLEG